MASHKMMSLLVIGLIFVANLHLSEAQIGVSYGTMGDNLPAAKDFVALLTSNKISSVRLMDPNKEVLEALRGTNIEVLLDVPNSEFLPIVINPTLAETWVTTKVKPFVPDVKIKYIVVGTDLSGNSKNSQLGFLWANVTAPIIKALEKHALKDIKITTACDASILDLKTNPAPSAVKLMNETSLWLQHDVLPSLKNSGAPLLINMYPYFELLRHQSEIKPEFTLFTSTGDVLTDGNLKYQNKFDAMLDSFYTALESLTYADIEIVVGQTGWPSAGGVAATLENEKTYITNLVQHVKKGTPKRPNKPIQVFVDLYDENTMGPQVERHFGVFTADNKIKFPITFTPSA